MQRHAYDNRGAADAVRAGKRARMLWYPVNIPQTMSLSVLHIGKFYPPHHGGIEMHVRDLATRQAKTAQVQVIVANSSLRGETSEIDGVCVTRVGRMGTIASMPVCPGLVSAIRRSACDLIHLHTPNPGAALAILMSGHRGKIVVTHHADTLGRRYLRFLSDPFVRAVMERAAAIIATSSRYLQSSAEMRGFREKCHVIPLGVDLDQMPPYRNAPARRKPPLVLAVGRLVPYKGFDILIRAMRRIDADLVIAGTGPQEEKLRMLAREQGVEGKVSMPGRVEDLVPLFEAASLFILPSISRAEAFGLVQLEAMAAGVPVINTCVDSGVPEVSIHGMTGLTVEPGNVDALVDAVNHLLHDEALRTTFGERARQRVEKEFTVDLMVARTLALYGDVVSQHGS